MKVSLNWIKELTAIDLSQEELISRIRSRIGEVEEVIDYSQIYNGILLAQISEKADHPSADKLGVYQLDIGTGESVQVVAGDKSLEVGDKVAYFTPGTATPYNPNPGTNENVVQKVKLRGVESNGMLASARELDITNNHERVMRISTDMEPGTPISEVLGMDDIVIDIENKALANRADCFGIIGLAREFAGIQGNQFSSPEWYLDPAIERPEGTTSATLPLSVDNQTDNLCPRYMAAVISNIEVKESPIWLQTLLARSGMRPINNIVDITNYIMLLTGQPLHAFDYDKLRQKDPNATSSAHIVVRRARDGEKITTLDGKTHELNSNNVVICDSTNPVAIGGVMGGLDTEIDENTTNIILESANFDKSNLRKTSMQLGIFSEAVTRFTKGQDQNICENALYRAIKMIEELSGGQVADSINDVYEHLNKPTQITFSVSRANTHLGTNFTADQISKILANVELRNKMVDQDQIAVDIPTYRKDLQIKEDLHEEIGRLYGYDNIALTLPKRTLLPPISNPAVDLKKEVRKILISAGADEILTYNFRGAADIQKYGQEIDDAYHIKNALSPDLEYMRMSILPSVLDKAAVNSAKGYQQFAIFEINKSHSKAEIDKVGLPDERQTVALAVCMSEKEALAKSSGSPYYLGKRYAEALLNKLGVEECRYDHLLDINIDTLPGWMKDLVPLFNMQAAAVIKTRLDNAAVYLGIIGDIGPSVKVNAGLPKYCAGFELNLEELIYLKPKISSYREPSIYPTISEDLCFILTNSIPVDQVIENAKIALDDEQLVSKVSLLDIYQTEKQKAENLKQVTISVNIQHMSKTLSGKDSAALIKKIGQRVEKSTGGRIKE